MMLRHKAVLLATFLGVLLPRQGQPAPPELTGEQFEKLHRELQPPREEAWRALPWQLSILEARQQAMKEKKPIFMLVRSGHPLGCV